MVMEEEALIWELSLQNPHIPLVRVWRELRNSGAKGSNTHSLRARTPATRCCFS